MIHRRRLGWAALLLLPACHPDSPAAPVVPVPASIAVVGGDRQQADPLDELTDPVRFQVTGSDGHPMSGVSVQLVVPIGGGSVPEPLKVSDSTGMFETPWTMGSLGGAQLLEARINGVRLATASATTCDPEECFPAEQLSSTLSAATLLTLATYDSSGQVVHPDVVRGHGSATGFWMAITPYPGGNSHYENPSIFRSADAKGWYVPKKVVNPIALPVGAGDYFSDPDMVVNSDQRLWLFFRAVISGQNMIKVMRSADGVVWDGPNDAVVAPNHELVSPAVVRAAPQAPWQMWSVNAGPAGCNAAMTSIERRVSNDGMHWGVPLPVELEQPGQSIWHIDVQWIPARNEYWALYNTYPTGTSCTTNALYLARSPDGTHWTTYPSPIARAGVIDAFRSVVYRSTFMTDPKATRVTLWISGARWDIGVGYTWQTATITVAIPDLLAIASVPAASFKAAPFQRGLPPPEPDIGPDH